MIIGKKTRLRPIEKDDLTRYVRWLSDPELRSYLNQTLPLSQAQEEKWYERNLQAGYEQAWAIDAQPNDMAMGPWQHIGSCSFRDIDWRIRAGEVGIMIGFKEYWGRGFGTDALQTLVAWGFYSLNLNRVTLRVNADNTRAIRAYEKVGFVLEGRLRQARFANGAFGDELLMAVLREDWARAVSETEVQPLS
ncbi:MAG TPA: GNAT family protein [Anaerolineales bacterium]|nr:GNAT family protein [Anaerolineales bacterium]